MEPNSTPNSIKLFKFIKQQDHEAVLAMLNEAYIMSHDFMHLYNNDHIFRNDYYNGDVDGNIIKDRYLVHHYDE